MPRTGTFKSKRFTNPEKWRCPECNSTKLGLSGEKPSKGGKIVRRYACKVCGTVTIYPKGMRK